MIGICRRKCGNVPVNQRRRTPRIAFVAAAELCDKKGGRQLPAQGRELSAYGCYVGTLNTFLVANTVLA